MTQQSAPGCLSKKNEMYVHTKGNMYLHMYANVHSRIFHNCPKWKLLKCPSTGEWLSNIYKYIFHYIYVYKMEYYSAIKRNKVLIHITTGVNPKNILYEMFEGSLEK
jgi:hypothetical protein